MHVPAAAFVFIVVLVVDDGVCDVFVIVFFFSHMHYFNVSNEQCCFKPYILFEPRMLMVLLFLILLLYLSLSLSISLWIERIALLLKKSSIQQNQVPIQSKILSRATEIMRRKMTSLI
jgi:hypothetical protein